MCQADWVMFSYIRKVGSLQVTRNKQILEQIKIEVQLCKYFSFQFEHWNKMKICHPDHILKTKDMPTWSIHVLKKDRFLSDRLLSLLLYSFFCNLLIINIINVLESNLWEIKSLKFQHVFFVTFIWHILDLLPFIGIVWFFLCCSFYCTVSSSIFSTSSS